MSKIKKLREILKLKNLNGFIAPSGDEFQSEFCPKHARRLEWLTGFSGSNGVAIVLEEKAAFFTDGRYSLQSKKEVSKEFEIFDLSQKSPYQWLRENLDNEQKISIDAKLHSINSTEQLGNFECVEKNLIDQIWDDQPKELKSEVFEHELKYSGKKAEEKISDFAKILRKNNLDAYILTNPDSVCWLLNIRANDLSCTPVVLANTIIFADGDVVLFLEEKRLKCKLPKNVKTHAPNKTDEFLKQFSQMKIGLDFESSSYWFFDELQKNDAIIYHLTNPCILPKAIKNNSEIEGSFKAHVIDGVAVTKFLFWLSNENNLKNLDEIKAEKQLPNFRSESNELICPSFDTIAGFGSNGAIVHYRASTKTAKKIAGNNLFLVDSGGQYKYGTTDITRTIAIGKPSNEQKKNYTLVLKGHIALASAIFAYGTIGAQLDVLARMFLWQNGLDYDHGTGHGVGSFLNVHEGPQNISKAMRNVPLQAGMIISNEPGYYKEGKYGIRIENLILVVEKPDGENGRKFLGFETITRAPLDYNLIEKSLLNDAEIKWLQNYQAKVIKDISPKLDKNCKEWLINLEKQWQN